MIILDNMTVGYFGRKVSPVIHGYIKKGSMIAIVGANGSGKSTFLKTLSGSLPPISGRLDFGEFGRPSISYLPQVKRLDYCYPLTVFDVVSMGCWPKISLFAKLDYYQKIIIWSALRKVQLLSLSNQFIKNLSGGQFQRMLFARILVQQASLVLLDEPFVGIDVNICNVMINAVSELCKHGCTVVIVLHDDRLVDRYFSNVLRLTSTCSLWKFSL